MAKPGPSSDAKLKSARAPLPQRRRFLLGIWCGALSGVLALTAWLVWKPAAPPATNPVLSLPEIDKAKLDPAVAQSIEGAEAEIRRGPRDGAAWGRLGMVFHAHELGREARACYAQAELLQDQNPRWPYYQ